MELGLATDSNIMPTHGTTSEIIDVLLRRVGDLESLRNESKNKQTLAVEWDERTYHTYEDRATPVEL